MYLYIHTYTYIYTYIYACKHTPLLELYILPEIMQWHIYLCTPSGKAFLLYRRQK